MQQLFNAADTSVTGYFGNPNALAAVGTNAENVALIVTLSFGLSVGANIIIVNRIEKNERRSVPAVTETVVILALIIDVIGFFIGQAATTCISSALSAFLVLLRLKRSGDFLSQGRLNIKGGYINRRTLRRSGRRVPLCQHLCSNGGK